jgi:hypothetical protein
MSLKPEEVKKAVLEEDDFGHEMRVGNILTSIPRDANHPERTIIETPEHGGTYTDSVTGKPRQFDFRCQVSSSRALAEWRAWLS